LNVQTGIMDKRDELEGEIGSRQSFCKEQGGSYTSQIQSMSGKLAEERANLATGTENQNQAEGGSHQKSAQHERTAKDYTTNMQECCANQNTAKSEICALKKIRGELTNMKGTKVFIVDCEVSDWKEEECSATCGGGTMRKTRSVIAHAEYGGAGCPPLEATVACNEEECPVDCVVKEWGGWSSCSAECGGGVVERSRWIETEASHGGEPCEATEEENACNIQSCDVECELSPWSAWSTCSKACNSGSQRSERRITRPAHGEGKCWDADDDKRLAFRDCNDFSCQSLLSDSRETLDCDSKVDVVIIMDGSANMGEYGWEMATNTASKLVAALKGSAMVAFVVYSGPESYEGFEKCTGNVKGTTIDMEKDCGIQWVSHLTSDVATLADDVSHAKLTWPRGTTLTSVALGQAEAEFMQGREDANSVAIVITGDYPMSQSNMKSAAKRLQEKAKVIWVPVGWGAPVDLIEEIAAKPLKDHMIDVWSFEMLGHPKTINDIISSTCPVVA